MVMKKIITIVSIMIVFLVWRMGAMQQGTSKQVQFVTRDEKIITMPEPMARISGRMSSALDMHTGQAESLRLFGKEGFDITVREKGELPYLPFSKELIDTIMEHLNGLLVRIRIYPPTLSFANIAAMSMQERSEKASLYFKWGGQRESLRLYDRADVFNYLNTAYDLEIPELVEWYAVYIAGVLNNNIGNFASAQIHQNFQQMLASRTEIKDIIGHYFSPFIERIILTRDNFSCVPSAHFTSPRGMVPLIWGNEVRITRILSRETVRVIENQRRIVSTDFSHNGNLLLITSPEDIQIYSIDSEEMLQEIHALGRIKSASFSANDAQIVEVSDHTVRLIMRDTGIEFRKFYVDESIHSAVLSPDLQKLVIACENGKIYLYDVNTKTIIKTLDGITLDEAPILFSPDSSSVFLAWMDGVYSYDIKKGTLGRIIVKTNVVYMHAKISPDGTKMMLVMRSTNPHANEYFREVSLYDIKTGQNLGATYITHHIAVVDFMPDGQGIICGVKKYNVVYDQTYDLYIEYPISTDTLEKKMFCSMVQQAIQPLLITDWILSIWNTFSKEDQMTISKLYPHIVERLTPPTGKSASLFKKLEKQYQEHAPEEYEEYKEYQRYKEHISQKKDASKQSQQSQQ